MNPPSDKKGWLEVFSQELISLGILLILLHKYPFTPIYPASDPEMRPIFRTIFALFNKIPDRFRQHLLSVLVGVVSGLGVIIIDMLLTWAIRYFINLPLQQNAVKAQT